MTTYNRGGNQTAIAPTLPNHAKPRTQALIPEWNRRLGEGIPELPLWGSQAYAQASSLSSGGRLLAPEKIVLYVHSGLRNTRFVDPLVCALERVLRAPITVKRLDLPLGPELLATPTQLDVQKVAAVFLQATSGDGGSRTFRYLLMGEDLKDPQLRYVFAESFGAPWLVGIVSTARLVGNNGGSADLTTIRVYKLILKSVARLSGYVEPQGCILSFPRSLPELDQKPSEFCADDRRALIAAGILKSNEGGGCAQVAMILP